MKFRVAIIGSKFLFAFLIVLMIGCSSINPVQKIVILPRPLGDVVPTGGWGLDPSTIPFPAQIMGTFNPGQEVLVGLKLDKKFNGEITFSKVSLLNRETSMESDISPSNLGPFEPGQVFYLLHFRVPMEQGNYEVRVYLNQKVAASALFIVG